MLAGQFSEDDMSELEAQLDELEVRVYFDII